MSYLARYVIAAMLDECNIIQHACHEFSHSILLWMPPLQEIGDWIYMQFYIDTLDSTTMWQPTSVSVRAMLDEFNKRRRV